MLDYVFPLTSPEINQEHKMIEKNKSPTQSGVKQSEDSIPCLLTIRQLAKKHPFMSEGSIRWLLFKNPPGLEECLIRISKRIYVDESKYFSFLRSYNLTLSRAS
jgi:hypothetical protein